MLRHRMLPLKYFNNRQGACGACLAFQIKFDGYSLLQPILE